MKREDDISTFKGSKTSSKPQGSRWRNQSGVVGKKIWLYSWKNTEGTYPAQWHHKHVIAHYDGRDSPGIMDSTHDTNSLGWLLYTIHCRDPSGSTTPRGFLLTKGHDAIIAQNCLEMILVWCGGHIGWRLRYMVTDDSGAEQKAVRLAFEGGGGVRHLLCTRHSSETLKKKIKDEVVLDHMMAALMHRRTEAGCKDSIAKAKAAANRATKDYIQKHWEHDTQCWAHWARCHYPLLLQSSTTNAAENWHKQLKKRIKGAMKGNYSLLGTFCAIEHTLANYETRASATKISFRSRTTALVELFPTFGFQKLPGPIQVKILDQVSLANPANHPRFDASMVTVPGVTTLDGTVDNADEDLEARPHLAGLPSCTCHWYLQWQLPCQHIWLHHATYGSLTPDHFTQLTTLWEHNGYEVYAELQGPFNEAMDDVIGMPPKVKVEVKYAGERVHNKAWCLIRDLTDLGANQAQMDAGLTAFTNYVNRRLIGLEDFSLSSWWEENRHKYPAD